MVYQNNRQNVMVKGFGNSFMNSTNVKYHINHKQQLNNKTQKPLRGQNLQQFNNAVHELCSMYDAVNFFGKSEYAKKNGWRIINKHQLNTATIYAIRYAPVVPKRSTTKKQSVRQQPKQQPRQQSRQQSRRQQPRKPQNLQQFYNAVHELCSMYDAVNFFGKSEYSKKNGWNTINKHQLNTATINAIRNAPVVPKRSTTKKQSVRQQPKQQPRQQSRQQNVRKQDGRRIGGCQYKPNVPRVYNFNTTPLPNTLYPMPKNYNHLFEAFNYFGNPQVRNIKSWIESSRTHKLNSIASVFAKRNAPHVPVRHNRSNKRNQQHGPQKSQQHKMPRNVPRQQSNKRQMNKRLMINQQPLSNVWEEYYVSPRQRMFK